MFLTGDVIDADEIFGDFDTTILDNSAGKARMSIEEATDFDDEVGWIVFIAVLFDIIIKYCLFYRWDLAVRLMLGK